MDFFGGPSGSFFWVSQVLLHCMQIYLKNLAKMRWKIETYILTFQTQKKLQKDKCSIQGGLYKGHYIQYPQFNLFQKNHHYGFFSFSGVGN